MPDPCFGRGIYSRFGDPGHREKNAENGLRTEKSGEEDHCSTNNNGKCLPWEKKRTGISKGHKRIVPTLKGSAQTIRKGSRLGGKNPNGERGNNSVQRAAHERGLGVGFVTWGRGSKKKKKNSKGVGDWPTSARGDLEWSEKQGKR